MLIYNSQTHKKEEFVPLVEGEVRMYVCGPTVYDQIHIGNARTFLCFDVIRRYLMHKGYKVTFAQNLTDVDDKIINRANEQSRASEEVAEHYTTAFIEQMERFGVLEPDIRPKATHEIEAMQDMIALLIEKGNAYVADNGDVYFSVRDCNDYGVVSGRKVDDLLVGARIEENEDKRDPLDFVLWKAAKPGEPNWESPWGAGRPGWHTECCAMIHHYLGTPIDIHGGGSDLAFPHHENENAQASCAWHAPLARVWMHSGMLMVDGEKMSKSLGNFHTLKEILDVYPANAVRLLMLQTHYRSPLDFSFERLDGVLGSVERLRTCVRNLRWAAQHATQQAAESGAAQVGAVQVDAAELGSGQAGSEQADACQPSAITQNARDEFFAHMDDDFNTAGALASVFDLVTQANTYLNEDRQGEEHGLDATACEEMANTIEELLAILGIVLDTADEELPHELVRVARELVGYEGVEPSGAAEALLEARAQARAERNWDTADAIRDGISQLGLVIEDAAAGSRIRMGT